MLIFADTTLTTQVGQIAGHLWEHWQDVLTGATGFAFVAHMVNTAPTPKNAWLQWALGGIKWLVGQRVSAMNAFNGMQSEVTAVTDAQKTALANGSTMKVVKTPAGVLKPIK